jgi:type III restriction enzyme
MTTDEVSHVTVLDNVALADYRRVVAWFTRVIMKDLRLFSGYELLYPKVQAFIQDELFAVKVNLDDQNTIRNLSESVTVDTNKSAFKKAFNALTVRPTGEVEIRDYIKLRQSRSFIVSLQNFIDPKKSVFIRVVGDSNLELDFASFLDRCPDVVSYAKNYKWINCKLDYVNVDGGISNYYPDFFVKLSDGTVVIVETKRP